MAITREDVRAVASLARLRLEPDEEARLTTELAHILDAFERLQALDTTGVPPTAHIDESTPRLRTDAATNAPGSDALLANAPARDERLFRVPRILE